VLAAAFCAVVVSPQTRELLCAVAPAAEPLPTPTPPSALEAAHIEDMYLAGIVKTVDGYVALLQSRDKSFWAHVGQRFADGQVLSIDEDSLVLRHDTRGEINLTPHNGEDSGRPTAGRPSYVPVPPDRAEAEIKQLGAECRAGRRQSCARLAEVAQYDDEFGVRVTAIEALSDPALLLEIATDESESRFSWSERVAAVEKLTDQAALARIARTDRSRWVRQAAVKMATDREALAEVARTENDSMVRDVAEDSLVAFVTDPSVLAEIVKTNTRTERRVAALNNPHCDRALLRRLVGTGDSSDVRQAAARNITAPAIRGQIAWLDADDNVGLVSLDGVEWLSFPIPLWQGRHGIRVAYSDSDGDLRRSSEEDVALTVVVEGGWVYRIKANASQTYWDPSIVRLRPAKPDKGQF
jgi:hypothetical protein